MNLLPSLEIKEFERQIMYLRENYEFISMDEVANVLKERKGFNRSCVVLTIDDGYLDSMSLAYPVIKKCQIPAMIYLTTGLIGTNKGLWVDDIEYAIMNGRSDRFDGEDLAGNQSFDISNFEEKQKAEHAFFLAWRGLKSEDRKKRIEKLFEKLGLSKEDSEGRKRVMLNWEEVRVMAKNGVSFGAHTVSHGFLPGMKRSDAEKEIRDSKETIEKMIGKPAILRWI
jgi:peptidoglycan/xylan/chitin deacetylase (PgdA/CDA1 family)